MAEFSGVFFKTIMTGTRQKQVYNGVFFSGSTSSQNNNDDTQTKINTPRISPLEYSWAKENGGIK